ncbi:MAG: Sjogren's syndrome/scleroderma autoantigen 1 family protein [Methanolinea sp.]|nr:Sjogren's syndrome/scleroderma autoantigen 1 family protein [Methanolinea sp.]
MTAGGETGPGVREDEVMARYLLKGGRMLSATCPACGCPLFDVKGETLCVVCREKEGGRGVPPGTAPVPAPAAGEQGIPAVRGGRVREALERAVVALCARAECEEDPRRARILMEAVRAGVEALRALPPEPGQE